MQTILKFPPNNNPRHFQIQTRLVKNYETIFSSGKTIQEV